MDPPNFITYGDGTSFEGTQGDIRKTFFQIPLHDDSECLTATRYELTEKPGGTTGLTGKVVTTGRSDGGDLVVVHD